MSVKYYIYAGGRWCEVEARNGRVAGWRARARFCFVRGGRIQAARTAPVLRALQTLAVGGRSAVREGAPLPLRPRRRKRSRSRRATNSCPHVCCTRNHSRCDQNANELAAKPAVPLATPSRVLGQAPKTQISAAPAPENTTDQSINHRKLENETGANSTRKELEKLKKSPRKGMKKIRSKEVDLWKPESTSESDEESGGPPKLRSRKRTESGLEKKCKSRRLGYRKAESVSSDSGSDDESPSRRKLRNSRIVHSVSSSDNDGRDSLRKSKRQLQINKADDVNSSERGKRSKPDGVLQQSIELSSSDADTRPKILAKSTKDSKPKKDTSKKLRQGRNVDMCSSSESENDSPRKGTRRLRDREENNGKGSRKTRKQLRNDTVKSKQNRLQASIELSSSDEHKSAQNALKGPTKTLEHNKAANAFVKSLFDVSSSDESAGQARESSTERQCKELVIDESVVEVLRRYLARTGGRKDLAKFDKDEDYQRKVLYKLNPLVAVDRCLNMEKLLHQRMNLKEFARHLGLRSVADVTPEKRYRMRRSTRNAKPDTSDSETDKENKVEPKKRRLWNREKELFNSSPSSRASEVAQTKPEIPKPIAADTSVNEVELVQKAREPKGKPKGNPTETQSKLQTRSSTDKPFLNPKHQRLERNDACKSEKATTSRAESPAGKKRSKSSVRAVEIPVRTLKEQNEVVNDSDSAFESSKNSQQSGTVSRHPKKTKEDGGSRKNRDNTSRRVNKKLQAAALNSMYVKPVKIKKSSVANGREYSSLEDHAIVAFVSVEGRERRVNGNRLWRELQDQYCRITGQSRSWHSLRNRYLRYILPSLGSLALPPSQVSHLRAAAATGEIKTRLRSRRNSIFAAPAVQSASARLRARADDSRDTQTEPPAARLSPRRRPPSPQLPSRTTRASRGPLTSPSK